MTGHRWWSWAWSGAWSWAWSWAGGSVLVVWACSGDAGCARQGERGRTSASESKADETPSGGARPDEEKPQRSRQVRLRSPSRGEVVQSPLRVVGEATGGWYFEATFPLQLLDAEGRLLAESYAQAEGEWMTESFTPFRGELRFVAPAAGEGTLVLQKANASGLPEHADELRVPVRFGSEH